MDDRISLAEVDRLRRTVALHHLMLGATLWVASWVAPIVSEQKDDSGAIGIGAFRLLIRVWSDDMDTFGSTDSYPHSLPVGVWSLRVAALLLVAGLGALAAAYAATGHKDDERTRWPIIAAASVLAAGAVGVAAGMSVLPYEAWTGQWWLTLPLALSGFSIYSEYLRASW